MNDVELVSLCIIDDIKSVVEGLSCLEWQDLGVELIGTAFNGLDGLALIEQKKPDIIITDIRMPKMDGLSMVRSVLEQNQGCKIILISSYTDFDYAREAIQLGAFDFVVKPFSEEMIIQSVLKAKGDILNVREKIMQEKELELKLRESLPLLRQEYMELLLKHPTLWADASKRWTFLDMKLLPQAMVVLLIEIDGFYEKMQQMSVHHVELTRFSLQNIVEETLNQDTNGIVFRYNGNRFVAVINAERFDDSIKLAALCCRNIRKFTKFTISIGVSAICESISGLPESYRQAEWALTHHLFTEGDSVIHYNDVQDADKPAQISLEYKEELLLALRSGNSEKARAVLHRMNKELESLAYKQNPDYLLNYYEEIASSAIRTFHELGLHVQIKPVADRYKAFQQSSGVTLNALQHQLGQLCNEGAELVKLNTLSEGEEIVYRSMEFIKQHIDREVTVNECAMQAHLSASYFSSLFKKVSGMTLTQYITAERIRKAKLMLINGVPVQEIASAVGYEERRYFSDMFKRLTGMTPSEFRESYQETGR